MSSPYKCLKTVETVAMYNKHYINLRLKSWVSNNIEKLVTASAVYKFLNLHIINFFKWTQESFSGKIIVDGDSPRRSKF